MTALRKLSPAGNVLVSPGPPPPVDVAPRNPPRAKGLEWPPSRLESARGLSRALEHQASVPASNQTSAHPPRIHHPPPSSIPAPSHRDRHCCVRLCCARHRCRASCRRGQDGRPGASRRENGLLARLDCYPRLSHRTHFPTVAYPK